jgi:hypothetical protein
LVPICRWPVLLPAQGAGRPLLRPALFEEKSFCYLLFPLCLFFREINTLNSIFYGSGGKPRQNPREAAQVDTGKIIPDLYGQNKKRKRTFLEKIPALF